MTRSEIDQGLREVFADMFDKPPASFNAETSPDSLSEWDSLGHIRLVAALEERFDLSIPPEDQVEMLTFDLIGDVLAEKLA